jgi:integrase
MARRTRASHLENRTARLKLPVRKKPYHFTALARGIALGYRRNQGAGTWVVRASDRRGGMWTKAFAIADDHEAADGEHVLDWWQAQDRARALARGTDKDQTAGRPVTVDQAIDDYEADLRARGADVGNANRIRHHLSATLRAKPVSLLATRELRKWRDGLTDAGVQPSTINRTLKALKAALNLAHAHDPRITNTSTWCIALAGLPDARRARHVILPESDIRKLLAEAWKSNAAFALWCEVAASTGARASQIGRLEIGDLQDQRVAPRLMVPSSRKGRGRKRIERQPVPISVGLAAKLRRAAGNRPVTDPLLLKTDGTPWRIEPSDHRQPFAEIAKRAGLKGTTSYGLRHSSIVKCLLGGLPTKLTASLHDTSVAMLEAHYGAYIAHAADADTLARGVMFDATPPVEEDDDVVIALPRRG